MARASRLENQDAIDTAIVVTLANPREAQTKPAASLPNSTSKSQSHVPVSTGFANPFPPTTKFVHLMLFPPLLTLFTVVWFSSDQLKEANSISDPSVLGVGQNLIVPLPCTCVNGSDNALPAIYLSCVAT
ncbi:hypothetical protein KIW84_020587 [Lathyrus oleraceus]|uniref:LysM domain-containing protein n=1 Tax=Pisum sativum TaxID=3888 RepID=A0A9D4Y641_PEA|nr:hypothetical protein KIW84_020587 [Pisum sativum]